MKKEKTIRTYQRRTKTGKVVTVKQHTAKYDAAEAMKEAAKKKGAGDELENLKKGKPEKVKVEKPVEDAPDYGFTADEYKAWYHWDQDADPKNKSALKVEKALKKQMGTKAYNKYFDEMSDSYSSRGHNKAFKGLGEKLSAGDDKKSVTSAKETKVPKEESLKVGSSIQMGNSTSLGKGKKETFKVLAVQKTNKQDRELGNTEAAWVQRKDGSVTLALKDSEKGWMYDDTWTDFTDRKHPYAKSLEAAGYSFKKAQGKGGKYWEVSKSKSHYDPYKDLKEAYKDYKDSIKADSSAEGKKRAAQNLLGEMGVSMQGADSKTKNLLMKIHKETGLDISKHKFYGKLPEAKEYSSKDTKSTQKGPGDFVVSKTLTRYKGNPSELSVKRRKGEQGYIIAAPSGMPLAKYDSASAAQKALKEYQESATSSKSSKSSSEAGKQSFVVAGLRMDPTNYNSRRTFSFDPATGEVHGRWSSGEEKRLTRFLNAGNRTKVANAIEKKFGAEAKAKFLAAATEGKGKSSKKKK